MGIEGETGLKIRNIIVAILMFCSIFLGALLEINGFNGAFVIGLVIFLAIVFYEDSIRGTSRKKASGLIIRGIFWFLSFASFMILISMMIHADFTANPVYWQYLIILVLIVLFSNIIVFLIDKKVIESKSYFWTNILTFLSIVSIVSLILFLLV